MRYYFHGDQSEEDTGTYYCASCDVFFDAAHFTSHGPHTGERLLEQLERHAKTGGFDPRQFHRPQAPVNALEEQARANRKEYQQLRPQFNDWLRERRKTLDGIGGMAANITTSRGLPTRPKSLRQLRRHYERLGKGSFYGIDRLDDAWAEFKSQLV